MKNQTLTQPLKLIFFEDSLDVDLPQEDREIMASETIESHKVIEPLPAVNEDPNEDALQIRYENYRKETLRKGRASIQRYMDFLAVLENSDDHSMESVLEANSDLNKALSNLQSVNRGLAVVKSALIDALHSRFDGTNTHTPPEWFTNGPYRDWILYQRIATTGDPRRYLSDTSPSVNHSIQESNQDSDVN